jgi:hypothetical protein
MPVATFTDRPSEGQGTDHPEPRQPRAEALRLTAEEAQRVRVAIRKVAAAVGGFPKLAVMLGVPRTTLYHSANPKKGRPSAALAIRLAAVAKVPVEVLLTGKLAVAPAVIGVAA